MQVIQTSKHLAIVVVTTLLAGLLPSTSSADSYRIGNGYEVSLPKDKCTLKSMGREKEETYNYWILDCRERAQLDDAGVPLTIRQGSSTLSLLPDSLVLIISEPMDLNGDGKPDLHIGDISTGSSRAYTDKHKIILNEGALRLLDIPVAGLRFKKVKGQKLPMIIAMDALSTCPEMVHGEPFVDYVIKFDRGRLILDESMTFSKSPLKPSRFERLEGYDPQDELLRLKKINPESYWNSDNCEIIMFEVGLSYRGHPNYKTKWVNGRVSGIEQIGEINGVGPQRVLVPIE